MFNVFLGHKKCSDQTQVAKLPNLLRCDLWRSNHNFYAYRWTIIVASEAEVSIEIAWFAETSRVIFNADIIGARNGTGRSHHRTAMFTLLVETRRSFITRHRAYTCTALVNATISFTQRAAKKQDDNAKRGRLSAVDFSGPLFFAPTTDSPQPVVRSFISDFSISIPFALRSHPYPRLRTTRSFHGERLFHFPKAIPSANRKTV